MARITTKSRSAGEPQVRQMRGPGMNKGLKKPRHGQFANPDAEERSRSGGARGSSGSQNDYSKGSSYLSRNLWR
jgi:hypothetical protein